MQQSAPFKLTVGRNANDMVIVMLSVLLKDYTDAFSGVDFSESFPYGSREGDVRLKNEIQEIVDRLPEYDVMITTLALSNVPSSNVTREECLGALRVSLRRVFFQHV